MGQCSAAADTFPEVTLRSEQRRMGHTPYECSGMTPELGAMRDRIGVPTARGLADIDRSRMNNVKLPHLSKLQRVVVILVLLFLIYLVFAGVVGGHG
jgi:hypothetical protein